MRIGENFRLPSENRQCPPDSYTVNKDTESTWTIKEVAKDSREIVDCTVPWTDEEITMWILEEGVGLDEYEADESVWWTLWEDFSDSSGPWKEAEGPCAFFVDVDRSKIPFYWKGMIKEALGKW